MDKEILLFEYRTGASVASLVLLSMNKQKDIIIQYLTPCLEQKENLHTRYDGLNYEYEVEHAIHYPYDKDKLHGNIRKIFVNFMNDTKETLHITDTTNCEVVYFFPHLIPTMFRLTADTIRVK